MGFKRGFTLVELAIVLVIIGLIMGMAIKGKSLVTVAKIKKDMAKIKQIETSTAIYFAKHNKTPKLFDTNIDLCRFDYKTVYKDLIDEKMYRLDMFNTDIGIFRGRVNIYGAINGTCDKQGDILTITSVDTTSSIQNSYYTNTTLFSKSAACYIELHLDDRMLNTGVGRSVSDGSPNFWPDSEFDKCDKIPLTEKERYAYMLL